MNKKSLDMLEQVFSEEIMGRPTFFSRSNLARRLAEEGYLERVDGFSGSRREYRLTHLGRLTYCASCPDTDE